MMILSGNNRQYWLGYMPDKKLRIGGPSHIYFEPFNYRPYQVSSGVELIAFYNPSGRKETMTKEKARIRWDELIEQGWYRVEK